MNRTFSFFLAAVFAFAFFTASTRANAAPETHILRIDPRAGVANGSPVLTTVTEVIQFNSVSDATLPCAQLRGNAALDCVSDRLEQPSAIWSPLPFPAPNARLLVKVAGADTLATLEGTVQRWGESKEKGVGHAWLIALDASSGMGARYAEARAIAHQFIAAMGPNDLMNIQIFNDRGVIQNSKWKAFADRAALVNTLQAQPSPAPSTGSAKPLFNLLKGITSDGFSSLGNTGTPQDIPLHQAMVILSNGSGRDDASSAAPSATLFNQFVTKGRFPEDNTSAPKTPLPVISVWLPTAGGLVNDTLRNNDQQFMRELANPQIGGFFDIVREGQGDAKGKKIIELVKQRFNAMYIAKWRLSCLNPTIEQTFDLEFQNVKPQIKGDASFKDVPIGVDPSQWPLDIDVAQTKAEATANPVHPGGTLKVYGKFCWGGDSKRAESYFIPAGTKPDPSFNSTDIAALQGAQKKLIAQNMRGTAKDANDSFAVFEVPDEDTLLDGTGDNTVARVLIYDNAAKRASGHDETSILTLKATKKPFNILLLVGIGGGVVVILLLVIVLMRGGGGKKRRGGGAPPQSPPAPGGYPPGGGYGGAPPPGGGYGAPGGGYGAPPGGGYPPPGGGAPPGGGYAAAPAVVAQAPAVPYAAPPVQSAPAPQPAQPVHQAADGGIVQVRCPSCQSMTMVTPGRSSVCFSCGQPLAADVAGGGGGVNASSFSTHRRLVRAAAHPSAEPVSRAGQRGENRRFGGAVHRSPRIGSARGTRSGAMPHHADRASRQRRALDAQAGGLPVVGA